MTMYYDVVLGLIPLALIGVTGTLSVAGFGLTSAVPVAGAIAALLVGHAMFVNAPVDRPAVETPAETTNASSVSFDPAD